MKLDKVSEFDYSSEHWKAVFLLGANKFRYVVSQSQRSLKVQLKRKGRKRKEDNFMCQGYLRSGMVDTFFKKFLEEESAKKIWDGVEKLFREEEDKNRNR